VLLAMLPAAIVLQSFKTFWICLWITSVETEMQQPRRGGPVLATVNETGTIIRGTGYNFNHDVEHKGMVSTVHVPKIQTVSAGYCMVFLRTADTRSIQSGPGTALNIKSGEINDPYSRRAEVDSAISTWLEAKFDKHDLEREDFRFCIEIYEYGWEGQDASYFKQVWETSSAFYQNAFKYVAEQDDFWPRMAAVNHALYNQLDYVLKEPLDISRLRGGFFTFLGAVLWNIPNMFYQIDVEGLFPSGLLFGEFRPFFPSRHDPQNEYFYKNFEKFPRLLWADKVIAFCGAMIQRFFLGSVTLFVAYATIFPELECVISVYKAIIKSDCNAVADIGDMDFGNATLQVFQGKLNPFSCSVLLC